MGTEGLKNRELPEGWTKCALADFTHLIMGQSPPSSTYNSQGIGLPFYQGKSEFGTLYPNPQKYCSAPKKIAKEGDVLLSIRAPVGPTNIARHKSCIGRGLVAIRPLGRMEGKFLLFLFRNFEPLLSKKGTGTTFKAITKDYLESIEFPLPPLPEQRVIIAKIEELFSKLDKGVESLKKARDQLKVYRQAVLKSAFEGKLTEEWRKSHKVEPAEKLLEKIKEERERQYQKRLEEWKQAVKEWEAKGKQGKKPAKPKKPKELPPLREAELAELSKLPEGWMWNRLSLLTLGVEYGTSTKSKKVGKVPVLRMSNIQDFKFDWSDLVYTDDEEEIRKYRLKKGDVLFNRTNSPELVGKTAIFREEREAIFAGYLIRINQIPTIIESYYLNYFLNSIIAKGYGNIVKTDGVNQSNISGNKLIHYPFPYCSIEEQRAVVQEIETRLSVVEKLEQTIDESLEKAEALRQSILKKAFEGKLLSEGELEAVRNDPEWEPTEKLLERIRAEKERLEEQKKTSSRRKKKK